MRSKLCFVFGVLAELLVGRAFCALVFDRGTLRIDLNSDKSDGFLHSDSAIVVAMVVLALVVGAFVVVGAAVVVVAGFCVVVACFTGASAPQCPQDFLQTLGICVLVLSQ